MKRRLVIEKLLGSRSVRSWSLEAGREEEELAVASDSLGDGDFQEWAPGLEFKGGINGDSCLWDFRTDMGDG